MYSLKLPWYDFSVNMDAVETWLRANCGPLYVGNSADTALTLWFNDRPDDTVLTAVNEYWGSLTSASDEATSYKSQADIKAAIEALKADAVTKTWNQLSAVQRKLVLGAAVTRADLGI